MKFSIIVPVYNVKPYLNICIKSILSQSFTDYEIILVDDGSTDGSGEICDIYQKYDSRVRIIHKVNGGLSSARNAGVSEAHAEYLLFVDSDDALLNPNVLQNIADSVGESDVLTFGWKEVPDGERESNYPLNLPVKCEYKSIVSGVEYLKKALIQNKLYPWYSWPYIFSRAYWLKHNFLFPEGKKYEDIALTYQLLLNATSVVITDIAGYMYRTNRYGAITYGANFEAESDKLWVLVKNIHDVQADNFIDIELKRLLCNNFSCLYYGILIQSNLLSNYEERKKILELLKDNIEICQYTTLFKQKLVSWCIRMLGMSFTAKILGVRRIIKHGGNG